MFFTSNCSQVRSLLWDLASGKVTGSDRERAEAHLARCEACRNELESYRNTISLMVEYKRDAVPQSRLGWRDVERRVASQGSGAGWAKRPVMQFAMGGGSLVLATALVMFVMQANMNPTGSHSPINGGQKVAATSGSSGHDVVSASAPYDFNSMASMLSLTQMPTVDGGAGPGLRSAPPEVGRGFARHTGPVASNSRKSSPAPQIQPNDVNVDGGSPDQAPQPEYVLTTASAGYDDDQNRPVIDVVSNSKSTGGSDSAEDSHPW